MSSNQDPMYSMVNSQNSIFASVMHANNFDFIPEMDPAKQQQLNTAKSSGYDANTFRPFTYTTNPMRQRHQPNPSLVPQYRENYYQNGPDVFNVAASLQSQPSSAYDFAPQSGHNFKQFHESFNPSNPPLTASHPLAGLNGKGNVGQHTAGTKVFNPQSHFAAGVQITSQTPFGPHIPVNGPPHLSNGLNNPSNANMTQNPASSTATSGTSVVAGQEEISTIFVVGFPDDMQEREFQNMFTFSQGFEAATLKIPNKDNTNYASSAGRPYAAPNDPFSLVPPNQGAGVENGRDGNWPADESSGVAQFGNNGGAPPRKQIIGFAKFRTRQDALIAKDLLQGKRIDMEKGAVLKAEMAKKNLHTKRGVGSLPTNAAVPSVTGGAMAGMGSNFGVYQQPAVNGFNHGPDPYAINGTESLGASAAHGLTRINPTLVHEQMLREWDEEDVRRRGSNVNVMGFAAVPTRGTRTEEDDRERRRDKEFRLRNGAPAFDPFSTYPSQSYPDIMRQSVSSNGATNGITRAGELNGLSPHDEIVGPWDNVRTAGTPARSASPVGAPQLAVERRSPTGPVSTDGKTGTQSDGVVDPLVTEGEVTKSLNGLSLSTTVGDTSPQLPSPASNASSSMGRSIDQNPPINTLYVGNLPSGVDQLEEKLRELFSSQAGFRRLCFRQKNNGPMCFVEFEDVSYATKALNSLHGHTLHGLVKGTGIRLSYSKNPLGVRTPTSAGGQLQQQQSQHALDVLQSRLGDDPMQPKPGIVRREANSISSAPGNGSSGNAFLASPPPRFYTSSPSASFTSVAPSQTILPRSSTSNILNLYNPPPNFAPFGFPTTSQPMIPDHHLDEQNPAASHTVQQQYHRVMSPPAATVEAARAS